MTNPQYISVPITSDNKHPSCFPQPSERRSSEQCIKTLDPISFGTITFANNKSHIAEFIRIQPDAPVNEAVKFLRLGLSGNATNPPKLVISVTGGATRFDIKPGLLRAFRRGLLKVAGTTGAWIITSGKNTGVMKLVGEIIRQNPIRSQTIPLIGIATWGCVSGRDMLDVRRENVPYALTHCEVKGESPLEPNHTKFILVDDGTVHKYTAGIEFRGKIEQALSERFSKSKTMADAKNQNLIRASSSILGQDHTGQIPVVLLVLEGGSNTIVTIHEAVYKYKTPAVLLEGTGRACNIFAKASKLYNELLKQYKIANSTFTNIDQNLLNEYEEEIKTKMCEALEEDIREIVGDTEKKAPKMGKVLSDKPAIKPEKQAVPEKKIDYFNLIYECIHYRRNLINIFTLNPSDPTENDIDLFILRALLNATSDSDHGKRSPEQKLKQFALALEWNRVDIAKKYIMKDDDDWQEINFNELFYSAIRGSQAAFVKVLLDHEFSLTNLFQNMDKLLELYNISDAEFDMVTKSPEYKLRRIYQKIIGPAIGYFFDIDAVISKKGLISKSKMSHNDNTTSGCCAQRRDRRRASESTPLSTSYIDFDKELFLWSVIKGHEDLAFLFWSRGKHKICAALIATLLYKDRAMKEKDKSYNDLADEFQSLSVEILDRFYQNNRPTCIKAIKRGIPSYGNANWLEIAVAADAKKFIAHQAIQEVFNDIWYGDIDQGTSNIKIIFSTFMIWYSPFLKYNTASDEQDKQTSTIGKLINIGVFSENQQPEQNPTTQRSPESVCLIPLEDTSNVDTNSRQNENDHGCWERMKPNIPKCALKIWKFISVPYVKYLYHLYFHMIFLMLYSFLLLCKFFPLHDFPSDSCTLSADSKDSTSDTPSKYRSQRRNQPSPIEYILVIWMFTFVCEELRQLFTAQAQTMRHRLASYIESFWNKLDVLAIVLFFVGFTLRFLPSSDCFCLARIVLSIDLTLWFIRLLNMLTAVKQLGPQLVMIGAMVNDLKFFIIVLTIFILTFGVSSYSLIYGLQEFSLHLLRDIISRSFWQIFGELSALEKIAKNFTATGYVVFILMVIYTAMVSVLLINLLIAMFSNTFSRLQTDTDIISKFQRYSLVCEYLSRPSLPPPLIYFSHVWRFVLYVSANWYKLKFFQKLYRNHSESTQHKISLDITVSTIIEASEDVFGEEVYYNSSKKSGKSADEADIDEQQIHAPQENILNRLQVLENSIGDIKAQQTHMCDYLRIIMDGLKTTDGDRINASEIRHRGHEESSTQSQKSTSPLAFSSDV